MEIYQLKEDIKVFYVTAKSFPQGVEAAYNELYSKAGKEGRNIYGLSKPENGTIVYRAAVAENFADEAEKLGCETYIIPKGTYHTEIIHDFMNNMEKFAPTFQALLAAPNLDWNTWCVEWYKDDQNVVCMVKMN
jgi:hypothetical protein